MKTLIIDNFDSFTYNLYQICAELGGNPEVYRNDAIDIATIRKNNYTHIILSPGPGTPENAKDIGICRDIIAQSKEGTPILGVCLGHQSIAHIFGGRVTKAKKPMHGKQSEVEIETASPIFKSIPQNIQAMRYHSLIADKKTLPSELRVIARSEDDDAIMAIQHSSLPLYGIQFHPESIGTPIGKNILKNFLDLKKKETQEDIFDAMIEEKIPETHMERILKTMAKRGESTEEIEGAIKSLQKHAISLPISENEGIMDTCGTGGSGINRMNISTVVAFVLATCGVKIAKHGNRAASGRYGSFDLLEDLGIVIDLNPAQNVTLLEKLGITFLFAPTFHPSMKGFAPIRKRIASPTLFNIIGPLLNPAKPQYHLLGTPHRNNAKRLAQVMKRMSYKRALIVSGEDGLDDISIQGPTTCIEISGEKEISYTITPESLELKTEKLPTNIGTREENVNFFHQLLKGKAPSALQNLLKINAAFGLYTAEKVATPQEGIKYIQRAIESGKAYDLFLRYKKLSNAL